MVVLAGAVVDLPARVATLDLNRRVPDGESFAEPALEVSHDVLGLAQGAVVDDDVNAERHLIR
jgi:hypothetical protein